MAEAEDFVRPCFIPSAIARCGAHEKVSGKAGDLSDDLISEAGACRPSHTCVERTAKKNAVIVGPVFGDAAHG